MKSTSFSKLSLLLPLVVVFSAVASNASIIETAVRSYTGATSSLHNRYASVNDNSSADPAIITDIMNRVGSSSNNLRRRLGGGDDEVIEIDTYFHILIANETDGDDVDEATIDKQLQVLNEAFGGETNSFYNDCDGNPTKSLETGFRFRKGGETTRTTVAELDDEAFLATITEEERNTLFFLLEQGTIYEDIPAFEDFLSNQTMNEQIETLASAPNAGLTMIPFLLGKKVRDETDTDDDCTKLHIYIQPGLFTPMLGYAQQPWNCRQTNEHSLMDGIYIHRATLPDSDFDSTSGNSMMLFFPAEEVLSWANQGDTAVHEVGHWLGLTHTFAGATLNTTGCDLYGGDEILDTPAQEAAYCTEHPCCNKELDTCPHIPGTDPVWNFMDYSDDCCMDRFTPMQAEKMQYSWKLFREDYYAVKADNSTVPVSNATRNTTDTGRNNGSSATTATNKDPSSVSSSSGAGSRTRFWVFSAALVAILMTSI